MIHEYQFSIDSIDAANKATHTTYAEDSICNGLAKGRRMLDKLFKDGALTAELWLMGDPADGRRVFVEGIFRQRRQQSTQGGMLKVFSLKFHST